MKKINGLVFWKFFSFPPKAANRKESKSFFFAIPRWTQFCIAVSFVLFLSGCIPTSYPSLNPVAKLLCHEQQDDAGSVNCSYESMQFISFWIYEPVLFSGWNMYFFPQEASELEMYLTISSHVGQGVTNGNFTNIAPGYDENSQTCLSPDEIESFPTATKYSSVDPGDVNFINEISGDFHIEPLRVFIDVSKLKECFPLKSGKMVLTNIDYTNLIQSPMSNPLILTSHSGGF